MPRWVFRDIGEACRSIETGLSSAFPVASVARSARALCATAALLPPLGHLAEALDIAKLASILGTVRRVGGMADAVSCAAALAELLLNQHSNEALWLAKEIKRLPPA